MISANKRLPVVLSDSDFGESDRVKMHHMASDQSSLGMKLQWIQSHWTLDESKQARDWIVDAVSDRDLSN